jgi:glucokinase
MDVLAIDIGGTKHSLALFREQRLERRSTFPTDAGGGRAWMLENLRRVLPGWLGEERPAACGIGFGGPVDFPAQRVGRSMHAGGWENFSFAQEMSKVLGIPCRMDNDANAGALGEFTAGAGRGAASLLYVTLSTGIGAGLLVDGKLVRGADSLAGELGHIPLDPAGPECCCGSRGCFEAFCSGRALEARFGRPPAELLANPEFRAGYVQDLAQGLKAGLLLLNPERVIIGGGIAKAGEPLFAGLREALRRAIPPSLPARVEVQPAALGDDSVLWGAAALAREILTEL